jgi:hypothetical protein
MAVLRFTHRALDLLTSKCKILVSSAVAVAAVAVAIGLKIRRTNGYLSPAAAGAVVPDLLLAPAEPPVKRVIMGPDLARPGRLQPVAAVAAVVVNWHKPVALVVALGRQVNMPDQVVVPQGMQYLGLTGLLVGCLVQYTVRLRLANREG